MPPALKILLAKSIEFAGTTAAGLGGWGTFSTTFTSLGLRKRLFHVPLSWLRKFECWRRSPSSAFPTGSRQPRMKSCLTRVSCTRGRAFSGDDMRQFILGGPSRSSYLLSGRAGGWVSPTHFGHEMHDTKTQINKTNCSKTPIILRRAVDIFIDSTS